MTTKKCTKCKETKSITDFGPYKRSSDKLKYRCKQCTNKDNLIFSRSVNGLILKIYHAQRGSSEKRGQEEPEYTKEELKTWILSNARFNELYTSWVESDYNKWLLPSVDRIRDNETYSISNIQLLTWKENCDKARQQQQKGILKASSKQVPVNQLSKAGVLISNHYSIHEAGRQTSADYRNIHQCCNGTRNTAGGFKWEYSN